MVEITVKLIQELREKTSAGMMDCKKALIENNGDVEAASDWLRKKGIIKAASKSGRIAASGLVTAIKSDKVGCVIEVNAETDFVAKNDKFQSLVSTIAKKALDNKGDFEKTQEDTKDEISNCIATIGENMNLRRISKVEGDNIYAYVHNAIVPMMGQIAVVVAINGEKSKIDEIGQKVAMHVAAFKPEFLNISEVDPKAIEREKKIFIESGATSGKPENVVEKMVEGRIKKYYSESVLEEQAFLMDMNKSVKQVLSELGGKLAGYAYYLLGEGIQKREDNLADEVNKMLGK